MFNFFNKKPSTRSDDFSDPKIEGSLSNVNRSAESGINGSAAQQGSLNASYTAKNNYSNGVEADSTLDVARSNSNAQSAANPFSQTQMSGKNILENDLWGVNNSSDLNSFKAPQQFKSTKSRSGLQGEFGNRAAQFKQNTNIAATSKSKSGLKPAQKVVSITYEEIGLFPRSFSRVLDRFLKQIFSDVENLVIQEYRFYRYLFLTTIQTIFILICVPLVVNFIAKTYLIRPITEYFWNTKQTEIFLNSYEQKRAFIELQDFEEKLYFESLLISNNFISSVSQSNNPSGSVLLKQNRNPSPPQSVLLQQNLGLLGQSPKSASKFEVLPRSFGFEGGTIEPNLNNSRLQSLATPPGSGEQENVNGIVSCRFCESKTEALNKKKQFVNQSSEVLPQATEKIANQTKAFNEVKSLQQNTLTVNGTQSRLGTAQQDTLLDNNSTTSNTFSSVSQQQSGQSNLMQNAYGFALAKPIQNPTSVGFVGLNTLAVNTGINPYFLNQSSLFLALADSLQEKTLELAIRYNNHSIESITNFFADFLSLITLLYLLVSLEIQINITKSFLLEVFFGLDDGKKSLLILIMTDLLVGYHSSNLWELFFQFIFNHYGIPESQTGIFLLVATLPVLLDVLFKYLIFRHLNRSSPATVATYHAIIE
jgi:hypothetical protein